MDGMIEKIISEKYLPWRPCSRTTQSSASCALHRSINTMMTSLNGSIFRVTGHLCGNSPVPGEFPAQRQWRGALMFSLICVWINDWVNNREAGDLRRYRAHYDVIAMTWTYANVYPRILPHTSSCRTTFRLLLTLERLFDWLECQIRRCVQQLVWRLWNFIQKYIVHASK